MNIKGNSEIIERLIFVTIRLIHFKSTINLKKDIIMIVKQRFSGLIMLTVLD